MNSHGLSIIIPTITGREEWLEKCIEGYRLTAPYAEFIVIKDEPSCGHAWLKGYGQSSGWYVHFTADDLTPANTQWVLAGISKLDAGIVPAANVIDGKAWTSRGESVKLVCDSPLGDMGGWPNVLVPLLTREMLELGNWLMPIHYGSDDWVTYRAVKLGYKVEKSMEYRFAHHVAPQGRDYTRRPGDVALLAQAMEEAGYLPPVYRQLVVNLEGSITGLDSVRLSDLTVEEAIQHENNLTEQMNHRSRR